MRPRRSKPLLTLDRVYVLAVLTVATAAALNIVVRPHDFWWHLAHGRMIVESGVMPTVDVFTYTQGGEPFFNQMWLAQVLMYGLHRAGGVPLVVAAHGAVIGLSTALVLLLCTRLTHRRRLSALVVLAFVLPLAFHNWAVRPQPYAFPLFVAFLFIVVYGDSGERSARRLPSWWWLPAVMVAWVNLHGSYVLGLAVVTLAFGVEAVLTRTGSSRLTPSDVRRLGTVVLATWAAALLNPRGAAVFRYAAELMINPSVATVTEWQPLSPGDVLGALYYLLAGVMVVLMVYGRRPYPVHAVVVLALMLLGFSAERHTMWFAFASAPLLCLQIESLLRSPPRDDPGSPVMNRLLAGAMVLVLVLSLPWSRLALRLPIGDEIVGETPIVATSALAQLQERPRRIFNDLGYGSYLAWALPGQKTFIDPRFELFPAEQVEDYAAMTEARGVEDLVDRYDIDGFLVSHKYQPELIRHLRSSPQWRLVHEDEEAALFVASDGA